MDMLGFSKVFVKPGYDFGERHRAIWPMSVLTLCHCRRQRRQATMDGFRRTDLVLTIRLSRIGKKKKPYYRVVVIERTRPRDGRVKEAVGTYDPLKKPAEIKLDAERIKYWIGLGAQPSDTVRSFLRLQKIA